VKASPLPALPPAPLSAEPAPADRGARPFAGHPLFSLANVYRAFRACRRRKRGTAGAIAFEARLENELVALHEELESGTWRPRPFTVFLVSRPKKREIFAADFRDRVVHHVLAGHLTPRWERRFIHASYACRVGKGTHAGVERLRSFTRQATVNGTREAWYLQLDIRGFFGSIDRELLFDRLARIERDPAVLWLLRTIVFDDPTEGCRLRRVTREELLRLPAHKTLFKAQSGRGLPIGNLTSQLFANVFLDALDQHVKHDLGARWYVRYCDDLVLLSASRAELLASERSISTFLEDELGLSLNERRRLRPVSDGIDFLGYVVRPEYLLVRRRVAGALKDRLATIGPALADAPAELPRVQRWLASYHAHLAFASSRRLVATLRRRHPWLDRSFAFPSGRAPRLRPRPRGRRGASATSPARSSNGISISSRGVAR
jgi:retron-type reverse transcriptase